MTVCTCYISSWPSISSLWFLKLSLYMWLNLQKPSQFTQELKSNLIPNIQKHQVAIDNQMCFHRWLFANPVKPTLSATGPVEPLESTNHVWYQTTANVHLDLSCGLCTSLLPTTTVCPNGREGPLQLAYPPSPPFHSLHATYKILLGL